MSAKIPRRAFAAPLVVTLAVPACYVTSGKPATSSNTTASSGDVRDRRTDDEPRAHVNPPRPVGTDTPPPPGHTAPPPKAEPGNDTMQQQPAPPPTTQQTTLRSWNVFLSGKDCYTSYNVTCPPKGATCNPPPPQKLARCPEGITAERPLTIREEPANSCALYYPMPECPPGVACNPPRPQKIECPTR